jgi:hypothetical protein
MPNQWECPAHIEIAVLWPCLYGVPKPATIVIFYKTKLVALGLQVDDS